MLALLSYVNGFLEAYAYHSQPEAPIITTKNNADTGSLFSLNVQKHIQPGGYNTQEIGEIILGAVEYTKITHTATIDLQKIAAYTAIKTAWHLLDLAKHSTTEPKPVFEIDNRMTTAKKFLNISGTEELEIFPIRLGLAATPDSMRFGATHDPLRRYTEEEMIRDGHTGLWFKNGDNTYSKIIKPEIEAAELPTDTPIQDIIRSLLETATTPDETVALSSCCDYLQGFVVGTALESFKLTNDQIEEIQDLYEEALTSTKKEFSLEMLQGIFEGHSLKKKLPNLVIKWEEINPAVELCYKESKKITGDCGLKGAIELFETTQTKLFKELLTAERAQSTAEVTRISNEICINYASVSAFFLIRHIQLALTGKNIGYTLLETFIAEIKKQILPKAPTAVATAVVMTPQQARLLAKLEQRKKTTAPAGAGRAMTPEEREAAEKARKKAEEELLKAGPKSQETAKSKVTKKKPSKSEKTDTAKAQQKAAAAIARKQAEEADKKRAQEVEQRLKDAATKALKDEEDERDARLAQDAADNADRRARFEADIKRTQAEEKAKKIAEDALNAQSLGKPKGGIGHLPGGQALPKASAARLATTGIAAPAKPAGSTAKGPRPMPSAAPAPQAASQIAQAKTPQAAAQPAPTKPSDAQPPRTEPAAQPLGESAQAMVPADLPAATCALPATTRPTVDVADLAEAPPLPAPSPVSSEVSFGSGSSEGAASGSVGRRIFTPKLNDFALAQRKGTEQLAKIRYIPTDTSGPAITEGLILVATKEIERLVRAGSDQDAILWQKGLMAGYRQLEDSLIAATRQGIDRGTKSHQEKQADDTTIESAKSQIKELESVYPMNPETLIQLYELKAFISGYRDDEYRIATKTKPSE